jgi:predicted nucleic acid-binding protein
MLYVTDTYPLVRYLIGELPEKSDKIFASAETGKSTIYIPTIVLAECLYLVEDGTINIDYDDLLIRIEGGAFRGMAF